MVAPKIRHGNNVVERISYTLSHGAAPSTCELEVFGVASAVNNTELYVQLDSSRWNGRIVDTQVRKDERGMRSNCRAIDHRDELFSDVVFAQINMIDRETGEVYSIFESDADPFAWEDQIAVYGPKYPKPLIEDLLTNIGFAFEYTARAEARLLAPENVPWVDSRYNIFNMDWNTGAKIGNAINEICDRLGLQFTMVMSGTNSRRLRFSIIGEPDFPNLIWEGIFANAQSIGEALQYEIDTGLFVVGDHELWERTDIPYLADWNEEWNKYALDPLLLREHLDAVSLSALTNKVWEFDPVTRVRITDRAAGIGGDHHFIEFDKPFDDMTISEYLQTVPFKVFRLRGMNNYLTTEEFNGTRKVRKNPITKPLVTDPGVEYMVKAKHLNTKSKKVKTPLDISTTITEKQSGHRLLEATGHLVFDVAQVQVTAAAVAAGKLQLETDDVEASVGTVTCVFYGPVFRELFGSPPRIGSRYISGLRIARVVPNPDADPLTFPEYTLPGEKSAFQVADDVAAAYLDRPTVVRSGDERFDGHAGHVPSGEIRRVVVNMSEGPGLVEQVSYANDEPYLNYDPEIEINRKMAQDAARRRGERIRSDKKNAEMLELQAIVRKGDRDARSDKDLLVESTMQALNTDNWIITKNGDSTPYEVGEPVVASQNTTTRDFDAPAKASRTDGDTNILGIVMRKTASTTYIPTITTGIALARVTQPVQRGDSLGLDKTNNSLKKVDGGNCTAMTDATGSGVTTIPVRIGGGGGGSSRNASVRLATTANITLSGTQTIDNNAAAVGDLVLVKDQSNVLQNGIYKVATGAWVEQTAMYSPGMLITVRLGSANNGTLWELQTEQDLIDLGGILTFINLLQPFMVVACATTTNHGLSGGSAVDGVSIANGDRVLVWKQTTQSQNGVYIVAAGAWSKIGQPNPVFVRLGTQNGLLGFVIEQPPNLYSPMGAVYT